MGTPVSVGRTIPTEGEPSTVFLQFSEDQSGNGDTNAHTQRTGVSTTDSATPTTPLGTPTTPLGTPTTPRTPIATPASPSLSQEPQVTCPNCRSIAPRLTVQKQGPNHGRPFFSCGKQPSCKFFLWGDGPINPCRLVGFERRNSSQDASGSQSESERHRVLIVLHQNPSQQHRDQTCSQNNMSEMKPPQRPSYQGRPPARLSIPAPWARSLAEEVSRGFRVNLAFHVRSVAFQSPASRMRS
eukprot:4475932-Pyramimonas_sp.AAC.1